MEVEGKTGSGDKRREKWDPTKFEEKSTRMIRP